MVVEVEVGDDLLNVNL